MTDDELRKEVETIKRQALGTFRAACRIMSAMGWDKDESNDMAVDTPNHAGSVPDGQNA